MIWELFGLLLVGYQLVAPSGGKLSRRVSTQLLVIGYFVALTVHFWEEGRTERRKQ